LRGVLCSPLNSRLGELVFETDTGSRWGTLWCQLLTVQKWENAQVEIPDYVAHLSIWVSRQIKQPQDDLSVQLAYCSDAPWLQEGKTTSRIVLEDFPSNSFMLRHVHKLIHDGNALHLAYVIEKGKPGIPIWNRDELHREIQCSQSSSLGIVKS
jgi:hypothetical protein